jgi:hypothetical protein
LRISVSPYSPSL